MVSRTSVCPNCKRAIDLSANPIAILCEHDGCLSSIRIGRSVASILIAASVMALFLFRVGESIWPLYLLTSFGVLAIYAVIFTRGKALGGATTLLALVVACWGAWELAT